MDENKIKEVFSDEAFVMSLFRLETAQEVQAAVQGKGLALSIEEIMAVRDRLSRDDGELSADELDVVAGGSAILGTVLIVGGLILGILGAAGGGAACLQVLTNGRW